jgi:soluble lytic murein transglycosylase
MLVVMAVGARARADTPAARLGAAFRAYDASDLAGARRAIAGVRDADVANRDYLQWLRGMLALRAGDTDAAAREFRHIDHASRFAPQVPWRLADCAWTRGDHGTAADAYARLIDAPGAGDVADVGTAMFRVADARHDAAAYRALLIAHPAHPLAAEAEARMLALGGVPLTDAERITRAQHLQDAHLWDEAVAELALVPAGTDHDYWLGITLFKMRRRYGDAGALLLAVYDKLPGATAPDAMFHGARALSRADRDDEAITWYRKLVERYPDSANAAEAQFLAGWLEFNRGHYKQAISPLERSLARYGHSKFAEDARWFLAMSHYFLDDLVAARRELTELSKHGGALEGGKGAYWLARLADRTGDADEAARGYRDVIAAHPMSWYALLAHARLAARNADVPAFGSADARARGPKLAATADEALASDPVIVRADELIAAGLHADAAAELERAEKPFLRAHDHAAAFATLLDRYRKAGDYFRPWMLAVSYCGAALDGPADGDARRWWENAYPRAYRDLVDKYQALGDNPDGYLYSIMRKESGFNPHDISYADAQGLLQMIPPTTERVAATIGIAYDPGKLYEPAYNVEVGSWYIGHLLHKFRMQIPIGAGSFNSGPKPVMKWLDQNGAREIDEFVELVPYTQTREYMKKVAENYARYRYLYAGEIYKQPIAIEHYVVDQLTY